MTKTNIAWLKPDQVEAMRDPAHEGRHGQRDDAIVTILCDTGLRRRELSQVDRDMLDLDDEVLRIPADIQKDYPTDRSPSPTTFELDRGGNLRTVRTLWAYLSARNDDSLALFPSRSADRMSGKGINDVVKRLAERAGVQPIFKSVVAVRATSRRIRYDTRSPTGCSGLRRGIHSMTFETGSGTRRY